MSSEFTETIEPNHVTDLANPKSFVDVQTSKDIVSSEFTNIIEPNHVTDLTDVNSFVDVQAAKSIVSSEFTETIEPNHVTDLANPKSFVNVEALNNSVAGNDVITLGRLSTFGDYTGSTSNTTMLAATITLPNTYDDYIVTGSITCDITIGSAFITDTFWFTRNRQGNQFDVYCEVKHTSTETTDYQVTIGLDYIVTNR